MTLGDVLRFTTAGLVMVSAVALPVRAGAEPVTLTVIDGTSLQQISNRPCVIGDPSCHNPDGFDFTLIPSGHDDLTLSSPTYTVDQFRSLTGSDTFDVGVDLNQAPGQSGGAYDLLSFTMSVNGTIYFSTAGTTTLYPLNPGNGYSDATISGFNLAGLAPTDRLVFTVNYANDTGGREQYFVHSTAAGGGGENVVAPVPEPTSILFLGTGLLGIVGARRRMKRS